jgi:hypothetical protein
MNDSDPVDDATTGPTTLRGAMAQVGRDIDQQRSLNAMHVPKDAGEHTEALRGMLLRIPDGWGRWIRCDRGWYPLLVELDEKLRTLLPNYELNQVKEKFGGLRYYWEPGEEIHDDQARRVELANKLIHTAEARAAVTCELCGAAGRLHRTVPPARRLKTLCLACAEREGYHPWDGGVHRPLAP